MQWTVDEEGQLPMVAQGLLEHHTDQRVFLLDAPMGAGKTTLIKMLCRHLGVTDNMSSPTYALVNEYRGKAADPIYHMDLYRLEKIEEALEIGIEEYLYSGHYVFIEWPQLIEPLWPEEAVQVSIEVTGPTSRLITTQHNG